MNRRANILTLMTAFMLGGLIAMTTSAPATTGSRDLPTPTEVGALYDFPVQDSYAGCQHFAEFSDPWGYCLDGAGFTDGESSLVGRIITGRSMTEAEAQAAATVIDAKLLEESGAPASEVETAEVEAEVAAEEWWETSFEGPGQD